MTYISFIRVLNECIANYTTTCADPDTSCKRALLASQLSKGIAHGAEGLRDDIELRFEDGTGVFVTGRVDPDLLRRSGGLLTSGASGATDLGDFDEGDEARRAAGNGAIAAPVVVGLRAVIGKNESLGECAFSTFLGRRHGLLLDASSGCLFSDGASARAFRTCKTLILYIYVQGIVTYY